MEQELTLKELLAYSNGLCSDGQPRSYGTLAWDKIIDEEHIGSVKELYLKDAIFNCNIRGNVAAISLDFPKVTGGIFKQAKEMSERWLANLENPEFDNCIFTLTITPILLLGQIVLTFNGLAYVDSYEYKLKNKMFYRLLLVFDNAYTEALQTEDIDFETLKNEVDYEIKKYEQELNEQIYQLEKEKSSLEHQINDIEMNINYKLNNPLESMIDAKKDQVENEHEYFRPSREEGNTFRSSDNE